MSAVDAIRVNGKTADSGSITFRVAGEDVYGFTEISGYKDAIEESLLWGYNKDAGPRGRTKGKKKPEKCTVKGPLSTCRALAQKLKALSPDGRISSVEVPCTIGFVDGDAPHKDLLTRCRILSWDTALPAADSSDAVLETFEMQPMGIKRDGIEL